MTTTDPLASRLSEVLCAASRRHRYRGGLAAHLTPRLPDTLLDEVAAGLAPVLRQLVAEAVAEHAQRDGFHPTARPHVVSEWAGQWGHGRRTGGTS